MTLTPDEREAAIRTLASAIDPLADRALAAEAKRIPWSEREPDLRRFSMMSIGNRWKDATDQATAALDAVLPLIERAVREDMRSRLAKAHENLGGVQAPAMNGDNLAVSLCSYFDEGDDWPEGDGPDDCGWSPSATNGYEQTIDAIRQHYTRALADEVRG